LLIDSGPPFQQAFLHFAYNNIDLIDFAIFLISIASIERIRVIARRRTGTLNAHPATSFVRFWESEMTDPEIGRGA